MSEQDNLMMLTTALNKIREAYTELEKLAKTDFKLIDAPLSETYDTTNELSRCVAILRRDRVTLIPDTLGSTLIKPEENKIKVYCGPAWVNGKYYQAIVRVRFDKQAIDALKPYQVSGYYFKKYYAETSNSNILKIAKEIGGIYVRI